METWQLALGIALGIALAPFIIQVLFILIVGLCAVSATIVVSIVSLFSNIIKKIDDKVFRRK